MSEKTAVSRLLEAIRKIPLSGPVRLMEVCGTHTMAIAGSGIKTMLPEKVKLISGPGCPVCVTPPAVIDAILTLAMQTDILITTYGDMVRVPGSTPGDHLARRRALGAKIQVVYSPVDAVEIARKNPEKEVVFLGAGFETTAPGTAAAVMTAQEKNVRNFSLFSMLKTVEPALRALMAMDGFDIQGFLCPGHVGTIIGEKGFEFLPEDYRMPAVIAGFEAEDILLAVFHLLRQISQDSPVLENDYPRAVSREGNVLAQQMMEHCFVRTADEWRGLGLIERSGLKLKEEFSAFDAERKFSSVIAGQMPAVPPHSACRCGDVICGKILPEQCPLFGRRCVPEDPVGPCMVSTEGACAAAYKYGNWQDTF